MRCQHQPLAEGLPLFFSLKALYTWRFELWAGTVLSLPFLLCKFPPKHEQDVVWWDTPLTSGQSVVTIKESQAGMKKQSWCTFPAPELEEKQMSPVFGILSWGQGLFGMHAQTVNLLFQGWGYKESQLIVYTLQREHEKDMVSWHLPYSPCLNNCNQIQCQNSQHLPWVSCFSFYFPFRCTEERIPLCYLQVCRRANIAFAHAKGFV